MKTKTILVAAIMVLTANMAQAQMKLNLHYEQIITERGELADYALECIGQDNAILEKDTTYNLLSVKRVVNATKSKQPALKTPETSHFEMNKAQKNIDSRVPKYAPLSEEAAHAVNAGQKARAVAKQIFRIRETRNYILSGEVEHMPADGKSMELVLHELNKQEKALMELFLGRKTIVKKSEQVIVELPKEELKIEKAIARFNKDKGIVAINDTTGEPIVIEVQRYTQRVLAEEQPKSKKAAPIYETKIVRSNIQVKYEGKVILHSVLKEK